MATINEKIEAAEKLREEGDHSAAESLFREVLDENPEKWQAWRGLGFIRLEGGEYQKSAEAFGKSRVIRADDVQSHYGYGLALKAMNDHAGAIRAFEEALYRDHAHSESKKAIAESLLAQVDHMKAIGNLLAVEEYLEKAHKYDPANHQTTVRLMQYYEKTGQSFKIQSLTTELQRHGIAVPDRSELAVDDAETEDQLPTTIDGLREAVAQRHENWKAWRALGFLLLEEDRAKEAEEAFRKATVIRPDDVESQRGLGLAFQAQGDHNHAIHAFEAGLTHNRSHMPTKKALNVSLLAYVDHMEQIGNLLAVEQYLEKAHHNDLANDDVNRRLLRYYNQTGQAGKKQKLIEDLTRQGIPLPDVGSEPERKLAGSEHVSPENPEADLSAMKRIDLEALVAQNGEHWQAWRALGFELIDEGDPGKAVDAFKRATVIRFDDADSQYGLGLAHQVQGNHAQAIHPFEEALRQNPRHDRAKAALKESLLAYADHMVEIGNLLAVEQFLEKAYRCDVADRAVGERLFRYYNETGQNGKAAKLAQEAGFVPPEEGRAQAYVPVNDDVLLYEEPVAKAEPQGSTVAPLHPQPVAASSSINSYSAGSPPMAAHPVTPASGPVAAAHPAMLPCPACRQPMPSHSKLCPHCGSMVDPVMGRVMTGRASQVKASPAEITYKVVCWIRIVLGALMLIGGLFTLNAGGGFLAAVGTTYAATGILLLLEIEWIQFLMFWGSLLGAATAIIQILIGFTTGDIVAGIAGIMNFAMNAATAWAIRSIGDV